jgi:hypothetical protein
MSAGLPLTFLAKLGNDCELASSSQPPAQGAQKKGLHPVPRYGLTVLLMTAPMTGAAAPDPGMAWVPVDACTLPTAEQPLRVAEFDELFATSLRDARPSVEGRPMARLILSGGDTLLARVQRLAEAETSCCSFFTFTVTRLDTEEGPPGETLVALDVEVPAARADVLDALVRRAVVAGRAR